MISPRPVKVKALLRASFDENLGYWSDAEGFDMK
jgi:hypothetical protein